MTGRPKKSLRSAMAALVTIGLIVGGLEIWMRLRSAPSDSIVVSGVSLSLQPLLQPSDELHHELRPNRATLVVAASGQSSTIRVNSSGCRGDDVPKRDVGLYRILMLGDETFFGAHVAENETVGERLHQLLPEATASRIEVINGGVPGDCPLLALLRYEHRLSALQPQLVILHVDMTDVADDGRYRSLIERDDAKHLCRHPSLRMPDVKANYLQSATSQSALLRQAMAGFRRNSTALLPTMATTDNDGTLAWISDDIPDMRLQVRHALEPIVQLNAALARNGARLLVVTCPVRWQVVEVDRNSALSSRMAVKGQTPVNSRVPFEVLAAFCAEQGIPFVNAEAAFRAAKEPARLFRDDEPVPSKLGLALYGREIAKFLTENPPSRWSAVSRQVE